MYCNHCLPCSADIDIAAVTRILRLWNKRCDGNLRLGDGNDCMEETLEWISQSEYDVGTAQAMLDSGRYIYAVFMCHLAVEKSLKAMVVKRTGDAPPRTHNLVNLLGLAQPSLTDEETRFITRLGTAAVNPISRGTQ